MPAHTFGFMSINRRAQSSPFTQASLLKQILQFSNLHVDLRPHLNVQNNKIKNMSVVHRVHFGKWYFNKETGFVDVHHLTSDNSSIGS